MSLRAPAGIPMPPFSLHLLVLFPWKGDEGLTSEVNFKIGGVTALNCPPPLQHSLSSPLQLLFLEAPAGVTVTLTILTKLIWGLYIQHL